MKTISFISALLLIQASWLSGQSSITVKEDPGVTALMSQYLKINRSVTHVPGWRVTVITTSDRRVMEQTRGEFQRNFSYAIRWEYKEPYYHLKAGAFLNKSDAISALDNIKKKFSTAFISQDKIAYTEL